MDLGIGIGVTYLQGVEESGLALPAGAYHDVDYLVANTTMNGSQIATATERGSAGGSMQTVGAPATRYQPEGQTVNGFQYADFSDVAADGFRDFLRHSAAASAWSMGADSDDDFLVACLFLKDASAQRVLLGTMSAVTASGAGFFMRQESSNVLQVGMTPAGVGSWKGLASSGALSDGWHVALCEWGSGGYAHYVDDMATPFASGSYTHGGGGGNADTAMTHGNSSSTGITGLGRVVLYERKSANQAERETIRDVLKATLAIP